MKVLFTASVLSHIAQFHKPLINMLKEQGYEVHVAAFDNLAEKDGLALANIDRFFNIRFYRNPFSLFNVPAYRQLHRVIDEGGYDIIHCNTPAVGVLTRLAARDSRKQLGTRVFYTAHGFHFFRGAPLLNWLLYYTVEKFMCRYTDTLVTINKEDAQLVQARFTVHHLRSHGVGADSSRFLPVNAQQKQDLRWQLGIRPEHRVVLFAGELVANKNQATLIKAAAVLRQQYPSLLVLLAGNGKEEAKLRALVAELQLYETVSLLGHKSNLHEYAQAADIIVSCSMREGLGLSLIEGMLTGKPVVASDNRGHREFILDGVTGFLVPPTKVDSYVDSIARLLSDNELYRKMSSAAIERSQQFADNQILPELRTLYGLQTTAKIVE